MVIMHLMALHIHGSSNPLGITGNLDRIPMHSYFIFKDLVTVFLFMLILALFVFYSPNTLGQNMALLLITYVINILCAVCWKSLFIKYQWKIYNKTLYYFIIQNILNTKQLNNFVLKFNWTKQYNKINIVSDLFNPNRVKYYYKEDNQQVTNINSSNTHLTSNKKNLLVDTSETTRTLKNKFNYLLNIFNIKKINQIILKRHYSIYKDSNIRFNQWLAGLIDGDGYFCITKNKYASCEILVKFKDEKMLRQIQDKFGGSVKLRSGVKAIRYRLKNKEGIIKLINAVNGNIRNSKRLVQFNKVCILLNIDFKEPIKLTKDNAWFIGFFDADGTINYYYSGKLKIRPQLTISVTNKYLHDVEYYREVFGGNIYFDKAKNGYFKWSINNKELHNIFYLYNKSCPSKSNKGKRLFLIDKFYYLYDLLAFKAPHNTALYKAWLKFNEKWNNN